MWFFSGSEARATIGFCIINCELKVFLPELLPALWATVPYKSTGDRWADLKLSWRPLVNRRLSQTYSRPNQQSLTRNPMIGEIATTPTNVSFVNTTSTSEEMPRNLREIGNANYTACCTMCECVYIIQYIYNIHCTLYIIHAGKVLIAHCMTVHCIDEDCSGQSPFHHNFFWA